MNRLYLSALLLYASPSLSFAQASGATEAMTRWRGQTQVVSGTAGKIGAQPRDTSVPQWDARRSL